VIFLPSGESVGKYSIVSLKVSCFRLVPLGFIVKTSRSPVGLFTPLPVVRALRKAILSLKAASASRGVPPTSATTAVRAAPSTRLASTALFGLPSVPLIRVDTSVFTADFPSLDTVIIASSPFLLSLYPVVLCSGLA
jgi:hypothetical protein